MMHVPPSGRKRIPAIPTPMELAFFRSGIQFAANLLLRQEGTCGRPIILQLGQSWLDSAHAYVLMHMCSCKCAHKECIFQHKQFLVTALPSHVRSPGVPVSPIEHHNDILAYNASSHLASGARFAFCATPYQYRDSRCCNRVVPYVRKIFTCQGSNRLQQLQFGTTSFLGLRCHLFILCFIVSCLRYIQRL
jgi:hypothetical protein